MDKIFEILFLEDAFEFLNSIEAKHYEKILYNIRKAQAGHDPELLKKLTDEIWENSGHFSMACNTGCWHWDKTDFGNTLVVSTHGFIKKRSKVPDNEIQRAKQLRIKYFENKEKLRNQKK